MTVFLWFCVIAYVLSIAERLLFITGHMSEKPMSRETNVVVVLCQTALLAWVVTLLFKAGSGA